MAHDPVPLRRFHALLFEAESAGEGESLRGLMARIRVHGCLAASEANDDSDNRHHVSQRLRHWATRTFPLGPPLRALVSDEVLREQARCGSGGEESCPLFNMPSRGEEAWRPAEATEARKRLRIPYSQEIYVVPQTSVPQQKETCVVKKLPGRTTYPRRPTQEESVHESSRVDEHAFSTAKQKLNQGGTRKLSSPKADEPPPRSVVMDGPPKRKFVSPFPRSNAEGSGGKCMRPAPSSGRKDDGNGLPEEYQPFAERLKGVEPRLVELVSNEILDRSPCITWEDIAGLEFAKKCVMEIVVWPMLRPDIFTGLRGPPRGLLLFGPPGTGKTMIGKAIASESGSTFFSISASSLMSKWVGEGEKMVRALFAVASCHSPAVIFVDEVDSILSQRSESDFEASRRLKTELFVQLDGVAQRPDDRVLVVGATNRPQELDDAARRRLVKRLYIPLPNSDARASLIRHLLKKQSNTISEGEVQEIVAMTDGYSGADLANLCHEAALGPIRSLAEDIRSISAESVRPIHFADFREAIRQVRASVSPKDLDLYVQWNKEYGSFG